MYTHIFIYTHTLQDENDDAVPEIRRNRAQAVDDDEEDEDAFLAQYDDDEEEDEAEASDEEPILAKLRQKNPSGSAQVVNFCVFDGNRT